MFEDLLKNFVVMFVVIEPVTLVPIFGALTRGGSPPNPLAERAPAS